MLILSVGMPRAGSGWYYNLTHDLVTASGGQDARQVRQRYFFLKRVLTEVNCNIGALTPPRLYAALLPSLLGNSYVIKAHAAPTPAALRLIRRGLLKVAYIYREPRDAMLSAYENGRRAVEKGRPNAFSHLSDLDKAAEFMLQYLRIWEAWMQAPGVLKARYEDLLLDYPTEAGRLVEFLKLDSSNPEIQAVIARYAPAAARQSQEQGQKGIHFSQGVTGRFRKKLDAAQQERLAQAFGPYLEKMGYPI